MILSNQSTFLQVNDKFIQDFGQDIGDIGVEEAIRIWRFEHDLDFMIALPALPHVQIYQVIDQHDDNFQFHPVDENIEKDKKKKKNSDKKKSGKREGKSEEMADRGLEKCEDKAAKKIEKLENKIVKAEKKIEREKQKCMAKFLVTK